METKEIIDKISDLPVTQRAAIADKILQTLNEPNTEIEKAWMKEVDRRAAQVENGEVELVPVEEVFKELREINEE